MYGGKKYDVCYCDIYESVYQTLGYDENKEWLTIRNLMKVFVI